jgi:hypothetical protein
MPTACRIKGKANPKAETPLPDSFCYGNGVQVIGRVFTFAVFTEAVSLMPTDRFSRTLNQSD